MYSQNSTEALIKLLVSVLSALVYYQNSSHSQATKCLDPNQCLLVYHQNSSQVDIDEQMILISASLCIDIDEQIYESLSVSSWVYTGHVSALYL